MALPFNCRRESDLEEKLFGSVDKQDELAQKYQKIMVCIYASDWNEMAAGAASELANALLVLNRTMRGDLGHIVEESLTFEAAYDAVLEAHATLEAFLDTAFKVMLLQDTRRHAPEKATVACEGPLTKDDRDRMERIIRTFKCNEFVKRNEFRITDPNEDNA